jgi:hypothetical protein
VSGSANPSFDHTSTLDPWAEEFVPSGLEDQIREAEEKVRTALGVLIPPPEVYQEWQEKVFSLKKKFLDEEMIGEEELQLSSLLPLHNQLILAQEALRQYFEWIALAPYHAPCPHFQRYETKLFDYLALTHAILQGLEDVKKALKERYQAEVQELPIFYDHHGSPELQWAGSYLAKQGIIILQQDRPKSAVCEPSRVASVFLQPRSVSALAHDAGYHPSEMK